MTISLFELFKIGVGSSAGPATSSFGFIEIMTSSWWSW